MFSLPSRLFALPVSDWGGHDIIVLTYTFSSAQYTKAMRLFKDEPKWTPLNRGTETDANSYRKEYLQALDGGVPVTV